MLRWNLFVFENSAKHDEHGAVYHHCRYNSENLKAKRVYLEAYTSILTVGKEALVSSLVDRSHIDIRSFIFVFVTMSYEVESQFIFIFYFLFLFI